MTPPYLLAIETSGRSASVALTSNPADDEPQLLGERTLDPGDRTAKVLIPCIHGLMTDANIDCKQLAAVAVAAGPGSFTGLRIGITAAKTIAYATGAKLTCISTLDVLAYQSGFAADGRVWAVLDAQRGDVFAACYTATERHALGQSDRTQLLTGDEWITELAAGDLIIGPVVQRYVDRLPAGVEVAAAEHCTPRASSVATLGWESIECGRLSDLFQLIPQYHRLSAAEEKARRKQ